MAFKNILALFLGIVVVVLSSSPSSCDSSSADEASLMQLQSQGMLHQPELPKWGSESFFGPAPGHFDLPKLTPCSQCTSYPNIIRMGGKARAGISDRLTDVSFWSSVAGSLCARLEMRPPCEKLQYGIYGNMSRSVKWTHFIQVVADDGSSQVSPPDNVSGPRVNISMHGSFASRYAEARAALESGKAFDWLFNYDAFTLFGGSESTTKKIYGGNTSEAFMPKVLAMVDDRRRFCQDSALHPSNDVQRIITAFHSKLSMKSGEYVALHIRRGDAIKACDTAVSAVVKYVTCSLSKNSSFDAYPVIFFTDEQDPAYLDKLTAKLTQGFGGRRKIYHGDAVLTPLVPNASNKFLGGQVLLFTTEIKLRQMAGVELLMDRTHCVSCETTPQPTQLCSGHCGFEEYVRQSEMNVDAKANKVMKESGGIVMFDRPACEQKTFPSLDDNDGDTMVNGVALPAGSKEIWLAMHPNQIGK